ncbi:S-adenosyl-L-methionine-dependent methyltransferase [Apodospora peruviana]|uniref:S-adenosyl-L-methionine-dependent methyltransferase n=1 Tax=Apodospora peruviana TaxID=516989 RepID=A0AAE0IIP2_9PEZI|nr:S-adenosyl-L-methionine-dependent methyltransferase [Apodospora peruviana]
MATSSISEIVLALLFPWKFMSISLSYLPGTIISALRAGQFRTLLSWPRLQAAWFSRFWSWAGPQVRTGAEQIVRPLLEGRVSRGAIVPPTSSPSVGAHLGVAGTVLEIGPGSGMWVSIFSDRYQQSKTSTPDTKGVRGKVTRVYGVEPNEGVHHLLREQIAAADLQDVYEVVPVGIEDLASSGHVAPESVDCIVSVLCLCSIPEPERNIAMLYGYLKPGGRWYVYEHVKHDRSTSTMGFYQAFVNLIWPHFIGGCELRRDTGKWLREAGTWSEIDLEHPEGEPWFATIPHVVGVLTK